MRMNGKKDNVDWNHGELFQNGDVNGIGVFSFCFLFVT